MRILDSYYRLGANNFNKDLEKSILANFQDSVLLRLSAVKTDDGEVFMSVYGSKSAGFYAHYYYDADGNESEEAIWSKKLKHFSYNPETKTYQEHISSKSIIGQDADKPHKSFEVYESRFSKEQSLVAFDPEYGRPCNIYQLCNGEIQFTKQHNLCGRTFLEFSVANKENFPGPVMVESNGKRLTHWEGSRFQTFPDLGIILQSKRPDLDGTNMAEYNVFDVTMENNPCLLSGKVDVKIDPDTGGVSCGTEKGHIFGTYNKIDTRKEQFVLQELRTSYQQWQQKMEDAKNKMEPAKKQTANKINFFQKMKKSFSR